MPQLKSVGNMDWNNINSITELANKRYPCSGNQAFIDGANTIINFLNDIIKSSFDSEDIGDKVCLLVKKIEEKGYDDFYG